jgi:hypothetical protein
MAAFVNFRKLDEDVRRGIILLDRPLKKTLREVVFLKIQASHPGSFERFHFIRGDPHCFFETPFGGCVIVHFSINRSEIQQGTAVRGIHSTGPLHDLGTLLKIAPLPEIGRVLHHSSKRSVGNQSLSFQFHRHHSIIKTAVVRASSLLRVERRLPGGQSRGVGEALDSVFWIEPFEPE